MYEFGQVNLLCTFRGDFEVFSPICFQVIKKENEKKNRKKKNNKRPIGLGALVVVLATHDLK